MADKQKGGETLPTVDKERAVRFTEDGGFITITKKGEHGGK